VKACAAIAAGWLGAAALSGPAFAHHSRANFDLSRTVEIDGVVTEYAWRNPHAFVVIAATDETGATKDWTFEMNSTPMLSRMGLSERSLKPGEHVRARGNPDRDPARRYAFANAFIKDDGTSLRVWDGSAATSGGAPPEAPKTASSNDFTGTWVLEIPAGFDILSGGLPTTKLVTDLPVNAKGQAEVDAFNSAANPEWDCQPMSIPTILRYPYPFKIVRENGRSLRFVYEVDRLERVIHMDMREHPSDMTPSPYGHSIGWFDESGALVVDTAGYSAVRWGASDGIDSSERKTTREVYRLTDHGRALELTVTMQDPEYLAAPATISHRYRLAPDEPLLDYVCDPATARRHLTAGR
jgi:hypothetical protein